MNEDVLVADFQLDLAPDVAPATAALLVAMVAATATRDETELDVLLTEIGQVSRFWAHRIKFGDETLQ
jgi:hypothetical protein